MMIDYELQFKEIDKDTEAEVSAGFKRVRRYARAKPAFEYARRVEGRGIDVALAKTDGWLYTVWSVGVS